MAQSRRPRHAIFEAMTLSNDGPKEMVLNSPSSLGILSPPVRFPDSSIGRASGC